MNTSTTTTTTLEDAKYLCAALGSMFCGDTLSSDDESIIYRARKLIRATVIDPPAVEYGKHEAHIETLRAMRDPGGCVEDDAWVAAVDAAITELGSKGSSVASSEPDARTLLAAEYERSNCKIMAELVRSTPFVEFDTRHQVALDAIQAALRSKQPTESDADRAVHLQSFAPGRTTAFEATLVPYSELPALMDYPEPDPETGADRGPCCAHAYTDGWNEAIEAVRRVPLHAREKSANVPWACVHERARELLAAEFRADGMEAEADFYANNSLSRESNEPALRAVIAALEKPLCVHGFGPDGWREVERLSLLRLRQMLQGFEVRTDCSPLVPPATYLEEVTLTREFQPGVGYSIADRIRDELRDNPQPANTRKWAALEAVAWTTPEQLERVSLGEIGFIARQDMVEPAPNVPLYTTPHSQPSPAERNAAAREPGA